MDAIRLVRMVATFGNHNPRDYLQHATEFGSGSHTVLNGRTGLVSPETIVQQALGTVDFKPTLLGLLAMETASPMQGRNAAELLRTERVPNEWVDQTFVRIGESKGKSATG